MMHIVKNAKLLNGRKVSIGIENGIITCVGECKGEELVDAGGKLVIPPYFNMHFHLDSVFLPVQNISGTLWEGIRIWKDIKGKLTEDDVIKRATTAVKLMVAYGTLWITSHADITEKEFKILRALLKAEKN
jgi:Cytosine deaminase and related metal-dependent hydrolases